MKDASGSDVWNECRAWALANLDKFEHVDAAFVESIPARVSNSITESTLHGCPPAEIERIATYLITEKGLNTYIKCNPTLLGYEFARQRLNELGFDYIVFDDTHFREDLQWVDAVPMFERLIALCAERGLEFGVKLTNTFPVDVTRNELPSTEMYMSGRSLFSLTIELPVVLPSSSMASCASATPAVPRSTTSAPCTMPAFGPLPWRPTCSSPVATSVLARWPASLAIWAASRLRAFRSRQ